MAITVKSLPLSLFFRSSKLIPYLPLGVGPTKCFFSSYPTTPYPLKYDLIISRPSPRHPIKLPPPPSKYTKSPESNSPPQVTFNDWVDTKLAQNKTMDKTQKKYYRKREKRLYGGDDSDDERGKMRENNEVFELKPEVVELKHCIRGKRSCIFMMLLVFHCRKISIIRWFISWRISISLIIVWIRLFWKVGGVKKGGGDDKGLVFFEEGRRKEGEMKIMGILRICLRRKLRSFSRILKKVPDKNGVIFGVCVPFLASRVSGLPPKWDSPCGTVVLVNKPKGVCFFCCFSCF